MRTLFCPSSSLGRGVVASLARVLGPLALLLAIGSWGLGTAALAQCPVAWLPGIGTPGTNSQVTALAVLPGGDLIVGGFFTSAGGVPANNIARYNPTTGVWSALGSGTSSTVSSIAVLPDGDVIVGGYFNTAGGVPARSIARYSPTTGVWSALGAGTNSAVLALAVLPGGDVIVGGQFTTAGIMSANSIARCNPATGSWSALGVGTISSVFALAVLPTGDLLVGGNFNEAGGLPANYIARYNLASGVWSALGSGMQSHVRTFALLPDGDVLVGGSFTRAADVAASKIARYKPSTGAWSALGSGLNDFVEAVAVLPSGLVIVGGNFTTAGGVPARSIARYDPTTGNWSGLDSGMNDYANAFAALPGGDVIAGGRFTTAGGVTANRIARCTPGAFAPGITVQPLPITTVASGNAVFYVGAAAGAGSTGGPTYRWRKGGIEINPIANPSAATPALSLTSVQAADVGSFDCLITNSCGGTGTLSDAATLSVLSTIANDNCSNPLPVINGVAMTFSTVGATTDGPTEANLGFCCGDLQVNQDVWFLYTASCTGTASISLCGSDYDSKVAVYDGTVCPIAPNTAIAGNDDFPCPTGSGVQSHTAFACTAGNQYLIRVGGYDRSTGAVSMTVGCTADATCPGDFNQDGGIDGTDVQDFFAHWEDGC